LDFAPARLCSVRAEHLVIELDARQPG